jgi:hypothetical protein
MKKIKNEKDNEGKKLGQLDGKKYMANKKP